MTWELPLNENKCCQISIGSASARFLRLSQGGASKKRLDTKFTTLVRPHLEYAIQASSPFVKKDIDHLERLQRLATRMVKGCRELSY